MLENLSIVKEKSISVHQGMLVVPEAVSFSPSAAASSAFLPLFILELTRTASTPRRHTTRTHNTTGTAEKHKNHLSNASVQCTKVKCCTSMQDTQEGISYIIENNLNIEDLLRFHFCLCVHVISVLKCNPQQSETIILCSG